MRNTAIILLWLLAAMASAQVPDITSFTPISGLIGSSVTINGSNFSTTASNNQVYFGGAKANVTGATAAQLTVTVPAGATYQPISVTVGGLTAYSDISFLVTFPGGGPLDVNSFSAPVDLTTGSYPAHTLVADLDTDGKLDIITSNGSGSSATVFRNIHTSGPITLSSFNQAAILTAGTSPNFSAFGDIDGDGKLDLVVPNRTSDNFHVFRNTSTSGSISFASGVSFSGIDAAHAAIADIDLDGKPDVAVTSYDGKAVYLYRNTGSTGSITSGSLAAPVSYGTGLLDPYFVVLTDLDGDNKPDIAFSNLGQTFVAVYRNTSTPGSITFAGYWGYGSHYAMAVTSGDIDGDGKTDLITSNYLNNSVSVIRNTSTVGTISFDPAVNAAAGTSPRAISVGDLDGDGKPEIVASNSGGGTISVFKNNSTPGNISLATKLDIPTNTAAGNPSYSVALGDLDGDSKMEMVMGNIPGSTASIFQNQVISAPSISSFSPQEGPVGTSVTITGTNFNTTPEDNIVYFGATRATVTNAGVTSLTVTVPSGATYHPVTVTVNNLTAYANAPFIVTFPGGGVIDVTAFLPKVDFTTGNSPQGASIGDIDGDGKADMLVTNRLSNTVSVFRNTSTSGSITAGSLAAKVDFTTGLNPYGSAIGDVDRDGKPDVVVANAGSGTISVFKNTSVSGSITAGSLAPKVDFTTGANPYVVALRDIDGDGKPDLVGAGGSGTLSVLRNTSTSGSIDATSFASKVDFTTGSDPRGAGIADVDGDGKPDLVVANYGSNTVSVFRNTSVSGSITTGSFAPKVDFTTGIGPNGAAIGDVDGDGKPDLVVTNDNSSTVSVFRNTSVSGSITAGSFASRVDFTTGTVPNGIAIGDVDGDGKPDLVVTNNGSSTASVFKNTSSSGSIDATSFAPKVDFTTGSGPLRAAIGDVDGDGKADLVIANASSNTVSVLRNDITSTGEPTVQASGLSITQPFANTLQVNWTNGNGLSRIVVARENGPVNQAPIDGQTYTASSSFSSGTDLSAGNYVVYIGSGNSVSVTDVQEGASYEFFVFEYNGSPGSENYLTATATNNPRSFQLPAPEPSAQPTNLTFTSLAPTSFTGNFTAASGIPDGYLVLMSANVPPDIEPQDGVEYTLNQILGTTTTGGNNIYAVASGDISSFNIGSLTPGEQLFFKVYAFNGAGLSINYYIINPLSGSQYALANEPTTQATTITFSNVALTSLTVNFTNGNGASRLLVAKAGIAGIDVPSDGQTYTTSPVFGTAGQIGPGNYAIGTGSGPFNVTGLTPGTTYAFQVFESNGAPTGAINYLTSTASGNPNSTITVAPSDPTGPVLGTNSTPTAVAPGSTVAFSVQFSDAETGVASVSVEYGSFTVSGSQSATMTLSGSDWQYTVSAPQVGPLGLYYRFVATNGEGDVTTTPYAYVKIEHSGDGLTLPYTSFGTAQSNYRIISIPLTLDNPAIEDVFDELGPYNDKSWRVFTYQSGGYGELKPSGTFDFNLRPGKGYFLIAKSSTGSIKTGPGLTVPMTVGTRFSITLAAGWNLIGNPFNVDLPWTAVQALAPGVKLRVYNGNWSDATVLPKMGGGFVMMNAAGSLQVPAFDGGRVTVMNENFRNAIDQPSWEVNFGLRSGDRVYELGGIGMQPDAAEGYDRYDDFTLPRFYEYLEINHDKTLHGSPYSKDVVPAGDMKEWSFVIESNAPDEFIDITWDNSYFGSGDRELVLWDVSLQRAVNMKAFASYRMRKVTSREFKVFYGSAGFVKEKTIPSRLVLQDVYPNPSSGPVTLRLSVPELDAPVNVDIMTMQGVRLVRISMALSRGEQDVIWEGRDSAGNQVPAGQYLAIVRSGTVRQIKRFIIR